MKKSILFVGAMVLSTNVFSDRFDGEIRKVTEVGGYSQTTDYAQNHCVIYVDENLPTSCNHKNRGIVYLDKSVGNVMCSVSLSALATDKSIKVSSYDDCDPIHSSPVFRWVSIVK